MVLALYHAQLFVAKDIATTRALNSAPSQQLGNLNCRGRHSTQD